MAMIANHRFTAVPAILIRTGMASRIAMAMLGCLILLMLFDRARADDPSLKLDAVVKQFNAGTKPRNVELLLNSLIDFTRLGDKSSPALPTIFKQFPKPVSDFELQLVEGVLLHVSDANAQKALDDALAAKTLTKAQVDLLRTRVATDRPQLVVLTLDGKFADMDEAIRTRPWSRVIELEALAKHPDIAVRHAVVRILGKMVLPAKMRERLVFSGLEGTDPELRGIALQAVAADLNKPVHLAMERRIVRLAGNPEAWAQALQAGLPQTVTQTETVAALVKTLSSDNVDLRYRAAGLLRDATIDREKVLTGLFHLMATTDNRDNTSDRWRNMYLTVDHLLTAFFNEKPTPASVDWLIASLSNPEIGPLFLSRTTGAVGSLDEATKVSHLTTFLDGLGNPAQERVRGTLAGVVGSVVQKESAQAVICQWLLGEPAPAALEQLHGVLDSARGTDGSAFTIPAGIVRAIVTSDGAQRSACLRLLPENTPWNSNLARVLEDCLASPDSGARADAMRCLVNLRLSQEGAGEPDADQEKAAEMIITGIRHADAKLALAALGIGKANAKGFMPLERGLAILDAIAAKRPNRQVLISELEELLNTEACVNKICNEPGGKAFLQQCKGSSIDAISAAAMKPFVRLVAEAASSDHGADAPVPATPVISPANAASIFLAVFCALTLLQLGGVSAGVWRLASGHLLPVLQAMQAPVTLMTILSVAGMAISIFIGVLLAASPRESRLPAELAALIWYGVISFGIFHLVLLVWAKSAQCGRTADMVVFLILSVLAVLMFGFSFASDGAVLLTMIDLEGQAPNMFKIRLALEGLATASASIVVVQTIRAMRTR